MRFKHQLLMLFLAGTAMVSAQNSNVQSAADALKYEESVPKAKEYIDKAFANEATSNSPKMWFYRGKIYLAISQASPIKKPELKALDADAAEKAQTSLLNCLKTDKGERYTEDTKPLLMQAGVEVYNKAAEEYAANHLDRAAQLYKSIFELFPYDKDKNLARSNVTVESLYKNLYIIAYKQKDYKTAKEYLQKLIDANFNDPITYVYMSRVLCHEKDTAKAIALLDKASNQFEGNKDVTQELISLYYAKHMMNELVAKYTKQIEEAPDKEELYMMRGGFYQKMKQLDKAVEDYKKTLSINPNVFEANYNLAAIYFNEGAELINKANDIKNDVEYKKAKAKADAKFRECIPYLEKAKELEPKDRPTLDMLKQVYARTNETQKYNEVKAELEKL